MERLQTRKDQIKITAALHGFILELFFFNIEPNYLA